ncbi:MAG: hypothetical protein O2793_12310 [Proteobacteria bacterium]|nr:hypothetical protein [Pseudomonadota bacterium]MDA1254845.1 hypothetical protein [Pseudomonadota bacterium]
MKSFWSMLSDNSGQLQIIIAIVALVYAYKAYRNVLNQIDISNKQTDISIAQMDKLNNERMFELKLRLKIRLGEQSIFLQELNDSLNLLSNRLSIFMIQTKENFPESFEGLKGLEEIIRKQIEQGWNITSEHLKINEKLEQNLKLSNDVGDMEEILDEVEQNQIKFKSLERGIKVNNNTIDNFWYPMHSKDAMKGMMKLHNFE